MKRIFDLLLSTVIMLIVAPILIVAVVMVWLQDFRSPLYIAPRVAKGGTSFNMIKIRSMVVDADKTGVDSTSANDVRITTVGHIIRKYKLDELMQLYNVIVGDMSLVGPRPNVKRETDLYTNEEKNLLSVKPGITDISSIVFSDEPEILRNESDPDIAYNQLIRPGKSLLGLFYIEKQSLYLDFILCALTVLAIFSRNSALILLHKILIQLKASPDVIETASRKLPLIPKIPPGGTKIITSRDGNPYL